MAQSAVAAPGDPVVFADQALEDAVNAKLGNPSGTTITEADAATITELVAANSGITDLSGIEYLSNVEELQLNGNNITDVAPLSGLTNLEMISLNGNGLSNADLSVFAGLPNVVFLALNDNASISDVSALSGMTQLTRLYLGQNAIFNVGPLSSLTNLLNLALHENRIADITPLASLTSLSNFYLNDQSLPSSSKTIDETTSNPVRDLVGNPVVLASSDSGFIYDSAMYEWEFSTPGSKTITWSTPVTLGLGNATFSGTINQNIWEAVAPETPEVIQAICADGEVVDPQINLPDTEGITYTVNGTVAPGETVIIEATPADENHRIYPNPDSGWVDASGDHIYATFEITLDAIDCAPDVIMVDPPNGDLPVDDPCGPDNATWILPTGDDVADEFTWVIAEDGLLTAVANDGYVFSTASPDLDPNVREYGYAPDTEEECASQTDDQTLVRTGGDIHAAGFTAVALMAIGGWLMFAGRTRLRKA